MKLKPGVLTAELLIEKVNKFCGLCRRTNRRQHFLKAGFVLLGLLEMTAPGAADKALSFSFDLRFVFFIFIKFTKKKLPAGEQEG